SSSSSPWTVLVPHSTLAARVDESISHAADLAHLYGARFEHVLVVVKAVSVAAQPEPEPIDDTVALNGLQWIGSLSTCNHNQPVSDWLYLIVDKGNPNAIASFVGTQSASLLVYNPCRLPRPAPTLKNTPDKTLHPHFPPAPPTDPLTFALTFLLDYQSSRSPTSKGSLSPPAPSHFLSPSPTPSLSPPPLYFLREYMYSTRTWCTHLRAHPTSLRSLSGLWLATNDRIIGFALAVWIMDPATHATVQHTAHLVVDLLYEFAFRYPTRSLAWFMSYPAGLKLNGPLARFVAELGQWIVSAWTQGPITLASTLLLHPWLSSITAVLAITGGFSLVAGVLVGDLLLGVCVAHLEVMHGATHKLMQALARGLGALVQVFVGKQWNPLRRRTETAEFSGEQLLMGTLVFTMLVFLAPTVGVFWVYFESVHITIAFVRMIIGSVLWFLHTFPLFLIAIRFKEPERLPGPLRIEPMDGLNAYRILNEPIGWWDIIAPNRPVLVLPRQQVPL
ncbi:N-acetylglucosaminyl transferase component-domain-containing protein, partial [Catenaria anguillulae PL171]